MPNLDRHPVPGRRTRRRDPLGRLLASFRSELIYPRTGNHFDRIWLDPPRRQRNPLLVLFLVEALLGGDTRAELLQDLGRRLLAIAAAAGMILFIRLAYWLVRRKEGMGLGDAKLMAMLAAWLGLSGTLESFVLAILIATFAALLWLAVLIVRRDTEGWATMPLPFGTFLCAAALFPIFHSTWNLRGVLLNIQN